MREQKETAKELIKNTLDKGVVSCCGILRDENNLPFITGYSAGTIERETRYLTSKRPEKYVFRDVESKKGGRPYREWRAK